MMLNLCVTVTTCYCMDDLLKKKSIYICICMCVCVCYSMVRISSLPLCVCVCYVTAGNIPDHRQRT